MNDLPERPKTLVEEGQEFKAALASFLQVFKMEILSDLEKIKSIFKGKK